MTGGDGHDGADRQIENVVELYKIRICAALDGLSIDEVRQLVAEIEARVSNPIDP